MSECYGFLQKTRRYTRSRGGKKGREAGKCDRSVLPGQLAKKEAVVGGTGSKARKDPVRGQRSPSAERAARRPGGSAGDEQRERRKEN
nr:uncharacterized protein LOC103238414 [Chlorocebus sabaeus]